MWTNTSPLQSSGEMKPKLWVLRAGVPPRKPRTVWRLKDGHEGLYVSIDTGKLPYSITKNKDDSHRIASFTMSAKK